MLQEKMRAWRTFASATSESVAALEPYMQLFNQSHPSWPWFLGTLLTTGVGVCTGFHYIVKSQLHPIVRDVDQLVKSTQELHKSTQELQLNQKQQQQTMERMEKDNAAAFDKLIKNQEKVKER